MQASSSTSSATAQSKPPPQQVDDDLVPADIFKQLETFKKAIEEVEEALKGLTGADVLDSWQSRLEPMERAKLHVVVSYALNSLMFLYLRCEGATKGHPVRQELNRVKEYFQKIANAGKSKQKGKKGDEAPMRVDQQAAKRFVKHSLAGNQEIQDLKKTEATERAKAFLESLNDDEKAATGSAQKRRLENDDDDDEETDDQSKAAPAKTAGKAQAEDEDAMDEDANVKPISKNQRKKAKVASQQPTPSAKGGQQQQTAKVANQNANPPAKGGQQQASKSVNSPKLQTQAQVPQSPSSQQKDNKKAKKKKNKQGSGDNSPEPKATSGSASGQMPKKK
ncbi:hypothetical protein HDU76_010578 [Blyttiomyces sp. JEL0837]|nr:hypothetical protein HDU76_010578 [Blyttiomyces sp. JEL0837]